MPLILIGCVRHGHKNHDNAATVSVRVCLRYDSPRKIPPGELQINRFLTGVLSMLTRRFNPPRDAIRSRRLCQNTVLDTRCQPHLVAISSPCAASTLEQHKAFPHWRCQSHSVALAGLLEASTSSWLELFESTSEPSSRQLISYTICSRPLLQSKACFSLTVVAYPYHCLSLFQGFVYSHSFRPTRFSSLIFFSFLSSY